MDIAAQLTHPNIVKLYDSGCRDGKFYMLQEYCAGGRLEKYIKRTYIQAEDMEKYVQRVAEDRIKELEKNR